MYTDVVRTGVWQAEALCLHPLALARERLGAIKASVIPLCELRVEKSVTGRTLHMIEWLLGENFCMVLSASSRTGWRYARCSKIEINICPADRGLASR